MLNPTPGSFILGVGAGAALMFVAVWFFSSARLARLRVPDAVKPVVDLATQIGVGALFFVLVLVIAVLLAAFMRLVALASFAPHWLIPAAEAVEHGLFYADCVAAGLFLAAEIAKLCKKLWRDVRDG